MFHALAADEFHRSAPPLAILNAQGLIWVRFATTSEGRRAAGVLPRMAAGVQASFCSDAEFQEAALYTRDAWTIASTAEEGEVSASVAEASASRNAAPLTTGPSADSCMPDAEPEGTAGIRSTPPSAALPPTLQDWEPLPTIRPLSLLASSLAAGPGVSAHLTAPTISSAFSSQPPPPSAPHAMREATIAKTRLSLEARLSSKGKG
ncbi:hypothetical protein MVEN_00026900 [Mycena venus]|uniref:Uncharacterized protein n=1 Tax=Mycena venus TaxID=2733690 RepID=A0A8H6Z9L6_9AGAR|nr:hypothetical protein MVEN_00026900 [Mycena venus]